MKRIYCFYVGLAIATCGLLVDTKAATFTVGASGQDFTTIQAAHDDAGVANGDTLLIVDAILSEGNISLGKSLVIVGLPEKSIIQANADSGVAGNRVLYINTSARVVLVNLTIRHGVDAAGGGIYNEGLLIMNNCTVEKNVAYDAEPSGGGGIYNLSKLVLSETDFFNNYTNGHGGAINNSDASCVLTAESCSFISNYANVGGGAIGSPSADSIYINECVFENDTARNGKGGAILDGGATTEEIIYIGNSQFRRNYSSVGGGAIHLFMDRALIENCEISDNLSSTNGGGVYLYYGSLEMSHCTVTNNVANSSQSDGGGGIYNLSRLLLVDVDFINNHTNGHGGAVNNSGSSSVLKAENCTFLRNYAKVGGGAIGSPYADSLYIDNCVFKNDSAFSGKGGAILDGGGTTDEIVYIGNSEFFNNYGSQGGGAIHLYMDSALVENCIIDSNSSLYGGGGIYMLDGHARFFNCALRYNHVESYGGGGILIDNGNAAVENCLLESNYTLDGGGGGINIWRDSVMISNSSIVRNSSAKRGGGINLAPDALLYVLNTTISDNYAHLTGGGINSTGKTGLDFVTISNNVSRGEGGGLNVFNPSGNTSDTLFIKNSIIANNFDSTLTFPDIQDDSTVLVSVGYNFIGNLGNYEFLNNNTGDFFGDTADITIPNEGAMKLIEIIDPMLSELHGQPGGLKYRTPLPCSPVINMADDSTLMDEVLAEDMLSNLRPVGDAADMGAIETDVFAYQIEATVSDVISTGFSLALNMDVDGLEASNFSLNNGGVVTSATTTDGGGTYSIITGELTDDVTYTLLIQEDCYDFTVAGDPILVAGTGIKSDDVPEFYIFPNPAHNNVFVNCKDLYGSVRITICDITGKLVQTHILNAEKTIRLDISTISSGIYTIRMSSNKATYTGKLVIKQ
jgi:predicted outer membrane repeat protein